MIRFPVLFAETQSQTVVAWQSLKYQLYRINNLFFSVPTGKGRTAKLVFNNKVRRCAKLVWDLSCM